MHRRADHGIWRSLRVRGTNLTFLMVRNDTGATIGSSTDLNLHAGNVAEGGHGPKAPRSNQSVERRQR